jgi:hypothetical protein
VNDKMNNDELSMPPPSSPKKLRTIGLESALAEDDQQLKTTLPPRGQEVCYEGPVHHPPQHAAPVSPVLALQNEALFRRWLLQQCVPCVMGHSPLCSEPKTQQDESDTAGSFSLSGGQPVQTQGVTGLPTLTSEIVETLLRGHMNPDFTLQAAAQPFSHCVRGPSHVSTKLVTPTSVHFAAQVGVQGCPYDFVTKLSSAVDSHCNSNALSNAAPSFGLEKRKRQVEPPGELLFSQFRGRFVRLSLPSDKGCLSEYQVLLREQIDIFEATEIDLTARAQGRNKPIELNSVGIRCRHCACLHAGFRPRGAVYFPTKLIGLYHSTQNMAANHFASGTCTSAPASVLHILSELRERKSVIYGRSSQMHWEESALQQGVREVGGRLVFLEAPLQAPRTTSTKQALP